MSPPPSIPLDSLLAHTGWVRGLARRLAGNAADADDLEQETWLRMLRAPPRHATGVRAWIKVVLSNALRDRHRSEGRRTHRESTVAREDRVHSTARLVAEAELHQVVACEVLRLQEPYRAVLLLRYYEALPARVIAGRLGKPVGTIHTQLKRARGQLRVALQKRLGKNDGAIRFEAIGLAPAVGGWMAKGGALVSTGTKKWVALSAVALLLIGALVAITVETNGAAPSIEETPPAMTADPALHPRPSDQAAVAPAPDPSDAMLHGALTIRVTTGRNRPVEGATVNAYRDVASRQASWMRLRTSYAAPIPDLSVRTDATGQAHFEALRVGGWKVVATSPGFAPSGVILPRLSADAPDRTIELRMERGGRVAGRVFDTSGKPVADALVIASRAVLARRRPLAISDVVQ